MFDGPTGEPYRQFCAELGLERKWQVGDWYLFQPSVGAPRMDMVRFGDDVPVRPLRYGSRGRYIWLPTLADWLAMVRADENVVTVEFFRHDRDNVGCASTDGCGYTFDRGLGATPEEAAARRWARSTGMLAAPDSTRTRDEPGKPWTRRSRRSPLR